MADTLSTDIGQSSQLAYLAQRPRPPGAGRSSVDARARPSTPNTLSHIVQLTNTDIAVSGQYVRLGEQIQITRNRQDIKSDRTTTVTATAANEQALPAAIDRLADQIRKSLISPRTRSMS